jgi:C4-dicarboxylate transporter DctM subunit
LAVSTTLGAAAFGAASGSSIGTATVFTKLALPQMLDRGYDKRLASASIAIAGTLAVMIPPSAVMVIFGILTDTSIGGLLIAGVIPGFVFAAVLCGATLFTVFRHPEYAPRSTETFTLREKLYSLRLAGPLVLVIACIILGLYVGVFTPTEAGGAGAGVTLVLALLRQRSFKKLQIMEVLRETVKTSAMIFAIIICALIFSRFLAISGVANTLGDFLTGLDVNRWVIVLMITVIYLIFGMMMDAPALLAITLPIAHPVITKLGFDPIWFGVFVVLLVEIGAVTPPVGVNCFVVQATSGGRVELEDVFTGLVPYVLAGFFMLFLLCLFPQLALFLPQTMH